MVSYRHRAAVEKRAPGDIPSCLFTWAVFLPGGEIGPVGVTRDLTRSLTAVGAELRHAPRDAVGAIAAVRLNEWMPLEYDAERQIVCVRIDSDSGAVVFSP